MIKHRYKPAERAEVLLSRPQLLTSNRMQIAVLYTGIHTIIGDEVLIEAVVVAGNNSKFPIGSKLRSWPLGDYQTFNHQIILENKMKAIVKEDKIEPIDFSKPQLYVNVNSGSVLMGTGSVDTEEGTIEGIIVSANGSHENIGQLRDWYTGQLRLFTGEVTLKND